MVNRFKHPRTPHLPWSGSVQADDEYIASLVGLVGHGVVVTEKRDGECTSLYPDGYVHARSVDGSSHPWQAPVKRMWAERAHELPTGWRVVGENLYAQHSIRYDDLSDWLEVFTVFDDNNVALPWGDMVDVASMLRLRAVPVVWSGMWDEQTIRGLADNVDTSTMEGLVVRSAGSVRYDEWGMHVAKWVRPGHVQTDQHWSSRWQPNIIASP